MSMTPMSDTSQVSISSQDVAKLAALARIDLSEEELARMTPELQGILAAVATVSSAVSDEVPATSHPLPLTNVFRADVAQPGLSQGQALAGAPAAEQGRFAVPRILDEE
jgi:aspartyl-tRNA(Asn)/glutamyl-tRNA(Gln) amidotransferase subunit C